MCHVFARGRSVHRPAAELAIASSCTVAGGSSRSVCRPSSGSSASIHAPRRGSTTPFAVMSESNPTPALLRQARRLPRQPRRIRRRKPAGRTARVRRRCAIAARPRPGGRDRFRPGRGDPAAPVARARPFWRPGAATVDRGFRAHSGPRCHENACATGALSGILRCSDFKQCSCQSSTRSSAATSCSPTVLIFAPR